VSTTNCSRGQEDFSEEAEKSTCLWLDLLSLSRREQLSYFVGLNKVVLSYLFRADFLNNVFNSRAAEQYSDSSLEIIRCVANIFRFWIGAVWEGTN